MGRLDGKIAVITGGTHGIGTATVKLFQEEGATVIATGSSDASVEAAEKEVPGVEFIKSDAGSIEDAKSLVEHVKSRYGRIDIVFANAGVGAHCPITEVDEKTFNRLYDINIRGPVFLLKYAVPVMSDGGSIVLTSSTAGTKGLPNLSIYCSTKGALNLLGKSLAVELAPRKIRVNAISPGPIETNIMAGMKLTEEQKAGIEQMIASLPLARFGQAEEVAKAALYFASDDSKFTTGANLLVDGGQAA